MKMDSKHEFKYPKSFDEALDNVSLAVIPSFINIKCTDQASLTPPMKPSTTGAFTVAIS